MDYGHKMTDELLESLEKDITEIYANAKEDAQKKAETYFQKFEAKDKQLKALVDSGQMDEKDYKQWRTNHFMAGARYKAMADGLAADMTNANKIAASAINGHLPDVYATNYNWGTYKIEQDARMDTNFMIYDRQTVERLIRDKPELLPIKARIDVPEDMRWNKKQINGAITKGILTGASIPEMAKNLAGVADMNKVSALRNARTMTTSAENGGRIDSYQRAIDMGIKITQQWLATKDARTRPEHRELDGQEVPVGKPFKVDGYEINFPADPEAEPFLVYNCRCCLISNFKGFDYKKMDKYVAEKPMSYDDWLKRHEPAKEPKKSERPPTVEGWLYKTAHGYSEEAIEEMNTLIEEAPEAVSELWKSFAEELDAPLPPEKGHAKGYFSPDQQRVHFVPEKSVEGSTADLPHQLHFHEYGHNIDYLAGGGKGTYFTEIWKDEKGRTLEEIVYDEFSKKFTIYRTDVDIAKVRFTNQLKDGGMGAEEFVRSELIVWRKREGLGRDDPQYVKWKNELETFKSSKEFWDFYKAHTDEFVTDFLRKEYGKVLDENAVKSYIRKTRDDYSLKDRGDLSDMMERFTVKELDIEYPLGCGHGKSYSQIEGMSSKEIFAEMIDSSVANKGSLKLIKQELPETYSAFEKMLSDLLEKRRGNK